MDQNKVYVRGGLGLSSILGLIFVVLKFTGHITWSWWWVLAPFWISWVFTIILIIIGIICVIIGDKINRF